MLQSRLACALSIKDPSFRRTIRRVSTVAGGSGRVYARGDVVQRHRQDPELSVFKATSDNESFVVKRVSREFYDLSQRISNDIGRSSRLRLHTDSNRDEAVLVYPYLRSTLLSLIQNDPEFPGAGKQEILRHVGEAIQELHAKDWIHLDIKPDNILVNWTADDVKSKVVSDAVLGDFDIAFKLAEIKSLNLPYALGNAMWRSPEGQAGRGLTKASDIFSFGLVCLCAFGATDFLLLDPHDDLATRGVSPKQEIVTRHFSFFGPVPAGLFEHINDDYWCTAFKEPAEQAEQVIKDHSELRFTEWGKQLDPEAYKMIAGMTNLDPAARPTIEQVLASPWWEQGD